MYVLKTILTLCVCFLCAGAGASFMFHMANAGHEVVGFIAGGFFALVVPVYLFHKNEMEYHAENRKFRR